MRLTTHRPRFGHRPRLRGSGRHRPERPARRRALRWAAVLVVVAALVLLGAVAAWAQAPPSAPTPAPVPEANLDAVLTNIRNWIMGILIALAVVFVTIGFVRRMTANGDPGEISKSNEAFKNAAIGFGGAVLAPVIVEVLRQIVAI